MVEIQTIPCLSDNYCFLIIDKESEVALAIDPSEYQPVITAINQPNISLNYILCTHHHSDHVGGNLSLKEATSCQIVGYIKDKNRIPGLDIAVENNENLQLGNLQIKVILTPGHTKTHISYYLPQQNALFCGDVLFALGCGRLLEGSAEEMFQSLETLAKLPNETKVYCGHEYTLNNSRFALEIEPTNPILQKRISDIQLQRQENRPTIPSTIALEKLTNPFLRTDVQSIQEKLGTQTALATFTALRKLKDSF